MRSGLLVTALVSVALVGCHILDRHTPPGHHARVEPAQYPDGYPDQTTSQWDERADVMPGHDGAVSFVSREPGKAHHVWLHYMCDVNAPDASGFRLSGNLGVRIAGQTQGPVPVTVTREGATLTGLTRSSSDAFVVNSHAAESSRPADIDGFAYLFDVVPPNGPAVDIVGELQAQDRTSCHRGMAHLELWVD